MPCTFENKQHAHLIYGKVHSLFPEANIQLQGQTLTIHGGNHGPLGLSVIAMTVVKLAKSQGSNFLSFSSPSAYIQG